MPHHPDLLSAWQANSESWIQALEHQELASRTLATNAAIVRAVNSHSPQRILDVGCGEGWLCRALEAPDRRVVGIDGVETLIAEARRKSDSSSYFCYDYEAIRGGQLPDLGQFEVIVFNFALFEKEGTIHLLPQPHTLLAPQGRLVIQTVSLAPEEPAGWHQEDWRSLERDFPAPFSWYYRRPENWRTTLTTAGWQVAKMEQVDHPDSAAPLSLIIHAHL